MKSILRMTRFLRKHWGGWVLAFFCLVTYTALSLVIPRLLGQGIDTVIRSGSQTLIYILAISIVAASAIRGFAGYGNRYMSQVVSQQVSYDMRNELYDHLQGLSFAYHDKAQTGQLMSRATVDIEAVRMFLSEGFLNIIQTVLMIGGISYLLLSMDWRLALMTLVFMPLIVWRTFIIANLLRPIWLSVQQLIAALGVTLQESLAGIRVIKAFSRQKEESQAFSSEATTLYNTQISAARIQAFNMPMMVFFLMVPTAIILWYGGRQVIAGTLTIGQITQFILYIGLLNMPIQRLGFLVAMFSRSESAGQRILEILDTQSLVQEKPDAIKLDKVSGQVTFDNVSFSYDSTDATLSNISFSVQPGQLVALVGGSGSGKSTVINLISRFYDVSKGRIAVDGVDIRDVTLASLRQNVGIAQQDVFLFSATVRDNIAYGKPDASMDEIITAAKAAQIHDFIQSLPDGYNTWVGERGTTLSGGEKQRIVIARALLMNPSILILDDSTSSVDAETEHLIRMALDTLIKGRTTFVITHRLPIIRNADIILVLQNGKIAEQGNHEELMAKQGIYYHTYLSQLAASEEPVKDMKEE
jgi:ABC-type multidrug transport system fused ATPase/permease subunit